MTEFDGLTITTKEGCSLQTIDPANFQIFLQDKEILQVNLAGKILRKLPWNLSLIAYFGSQ